MSNIQTITLGGGCFWCVEAVYELVDGVTAVESGYSNGHVTNPSYEQVCGGDTGHAEVVRVSFDADRITLRQGNDIGTQYRSGIYFESAEHERIAREVLAEANAEHRGRVVTEVLPLAHYSKAEAYHQHYFARNPGAGYCAFVVAPKVEKFRQTFKARVKAAA
jgi:peptide-methionine (S)-S-oxide reductase